MEKFEIGDIVTCIATTCEEYTDDDRLILGENYKVLDIDYHFPNKIVVKLKGPYYTHQEFVPDKLFSKIAYIREKKLSQIFDQPIAQKLKRLGNRLTNFLKNI